MGGVINSVGGLLKGAGDSMTTKAALVDGQAFNSTLDPRIADLLKQRALGQQTEADQAALNAQVGRAQAVQTSQAASARGTNAGLAQRNAAQGIGQMGTQVIGQANLQRLQNQGEAIGQATTVAESDRNAKIRQQEINSGINTNNAQTQNAATGGLVSGIAGAGMALAMSDENKKEHIESGSGEVAEFLDHLKAFKYDYKEPEVDGEGQKVSVMAQDLEKSPIGKNAVVDTPRGKMVDYNELIPVLLAAQADLNKRLRGLEK